MQTNQLKQESVQNILDELEQEGEVTRKLPGKGILHLERQLPFLLIYRKKARGKDPATQRLVKSGVSYLVIGKKEFPIYKRLIYDLVDSMAEKFSSYLLFEIYSGPENSRKFILRGPAHKLPTTLDVLKKELEKITTRQYQVKLEAQIEQTKERQPDEKDPLISIEELKNCGGLLLGLEVPPVYRDDTGQLFPVYFRHFRDKFVEAIQKAVFDYLRVQTTCNIDSYLALGKRKVHEKVYEIDKKLTAIESSYQFLLAVAPVNIQEIRKKFFESDFKHLETYHYRLLTIDPALLKRRLYNLRIDKIDDPAIAFIFNEKREELDQQITMLNERGTRNFFYNGIRLYRGVSNSLKKAAYDILDEIPEVTEKEEDNVIDAKEFFEMAKREFDYFREQDPNFECRAYLRDDLNVMMVSAGDLYVPSDYRVNEREAKALIQHEVGTHVLTSYNGKQQPLSQLAYGLSDYDPLQEGLAVFSEYIVDGLSPNRMRTLAGRVVAGAALIEGGNFKSIFNLLVREGFTKDRAFNITSRIMQGGGFLKDIIYLQGLVQLIKYLREGGELEDLLLGKFALKHLNIVKELTEREILKPPALKPRYMAMDSYASKIQKIKEGLPLSKMIAS